MPLAWAYGVTTVEQRKTDLLPHTLASLRAAGFDQPRLFVDGVKDPFPYACEFHLEVTGRYPAVRTYGNWMLGLWELYLRQPYADRYAIFQDDFVTYRNLRQYLNAVPYPSKGYCNLYTFPVNQAIAPEGGTKVGWYLSNQMGKGAVALVFDREAAMKLLASAHMVDRVQDGMHGWKKIDGGVVTALMKAGIREYVHNPSLVQHTGVLSMSGNGSHPQAPSFRGENYNALDLL